MSQRIMFLRQDYGFGNTNPVGCIAIELTEPTPSAKPTRDIRYQVSVLNPADKFNRALARQLARGRLLEKPFLISNVPYNVSIHEISEVVMAAIALNVDVPMRARKAAAKWLGYSSVKDAVYQQACSRLDSWNRS